MHDGVKDFVLIHCVVIEVVLGCSFFMHMELLKHVQVWALFLVSYYLHD
jgi:hypothetical protein